MRKVYIGQTSRALKTRIKEHSKAIFTLDKNSLLAQHHIENQHEIDLINVEILDHAQQWNNRLFLEAWHSVQNVNSINEHIYFPNVYKNLENFQRVWSRGGKKPVPQCITVHSI